MNTADKIIASLNRWNAKQAKRQNMLDSEVGSTNYRAVLKSAIQKTNVCGIQYTTLLNKALLLN